MRRTATPGFLLIALVVTACGAAAPPQDDQLSDSLNMAPASVLPAELRQLPADYQEAYRFAVANPLALSKIPCYCGCGSVGHMDNWMCYLRPESTSEQPVFDYHAAG